LFGLPSDNPTVTVPAANCIADVTLLIDLELKLVMTFIGDDCQPHPCERPPAGSTVNLELQHKLTDEQLAAAGITFEYRTNRGAFAEALAERGGSKISLLTAGSPGITNIIGTMRSNNGGSARREERIASDARPPQPVTGSLSVGLRRTASTITPDLPLWILIRRSTDAMGFKNYSKFMDVALCGVNPTTQGLFTDEELALVTGSGGKLETFANLQTKRFLPFTDADAYRILKVATEAFVTVNCGIPLASVNFSEEEVRNLVASTSIENIDTTVVENLWDDFLVSVNGTTSTTLPYLALIAAKFPELSLKSDIFSLVTPAAGAAQDPCFGLLATKLTEPCLLELIWSYWHEEAMLVQTLNAVAVRFQNRRGPERYDPLANMEIDPLRPLNNLLWGYIQDEQHRLSVMRRAYEYDHHYGLRLQGRAVPELRAADTRSQFIQAFHNLLHRCDIFFDQDDDTTVISDGFPVLNALKEVHLILSQGAHNQFGDLPSTARIEMLMQEWILARPEFREFLPTRVMVAYPEPWMDRVDAMKKLQGWSDVNVLHFRDLGVFGEKLLLSIRFGSWVDTHEPDQAKNWARFFRPEIQGYLHAYRAVTGVDISVEPVNTTLPSVLLRERLSQQQRLRT
jgi:hypothetical protein